MRSSFIVHRNRTAPGHFLWPGAVFEPRVAYIRSRVGFNLLARGPSWGAPLPSMGKDWRPRGDGQARRPRGADAAASRETIQLLRDPDLSARWGVLKGGVLKGAAGRHPGVWRLRGAQGPRLVPTVGGSRWPSPHLRKRQQICKTINLVCFLQIYKIAPNAVRFG